MATRKSKNRGARAAKKSTAKTKKKAGTKPAKRTSSKKPKAAAPKAPAQTPRAKPAGSSKSPILNTILARLDEDQAANTIQIDLHNKSTIADYMVVTSGRSNRHVSAIADHVIESLHKSGLARVRVEGMPNCDWVLIDAGDVILHIFRPEVRSFYNLEKMWARGRAEG